MAKLKGSTLVEALVAMSVILFCSTLGVLIYTNVLSSQNSAQKLRAAYVSRELIERSVAKRDFLDINLGQQGMKIEKTCRPYKGDNALVMIKVVVKSEDGKLLWEQKQLILNE